MQNATKGPSGFIVLKKPSGDKQRAKGRIFPKGACHMVLPDCYSNMDAP
jgi:hypothetical protein